MTAYLAYLPDAPDIEALEIDGAVFAMDDRVLLIETGLTRSRLYHALKRQLPDGAALLVAPLADAPKFKGMADGALKAARGLFGDVMEKKA
jgi:hypothetical protein